jgi:acyl-CoA thioesterase FadM
MDVYRFHSTVTIGDTDLFQNMYFLNVLKLSGVTRELWVKDCVPSAAADLAGGLVLLTRDVSCSFTRDFSVYDPVVVELQFSELKRTHTRVRFRFCHGVTGEQHAEAYHSIVFARRDHRVSRIPENWRQAITRYLDADASPTPRSAPARERAGRWLMRQFSPEPSAEGVTIDQRCSLAGQA